MDAAIGGTQFMITRMCAEFAHELAGIADDAKDEDGARVGAGEDELRDRVVLHRGARRVDHI